MLAAREEKSRIELDAITWLSISNPSSLRNFTRFFSSIRRWLNIFLSKSLCRHTISLSYNNFISKYPDFKWDSPDPSVAPRLTRVLRESHVVVDMYHGHIKEKTYTYTNTFETDMSRSERFALPIRCNATAGGTESRATQFEPMTTSVERRLRRARTLRYTRGDE